MLVLVAYDINTTTRKGKRRLRRICNICKSIGQRVQYSLFECLVGSTDLARLRTQLLSTIREAEDSLRIYHLGVPGRVRIEHHGVRAPRAHDDPFVV